MERVARPCFRRRYQWGCAQSLCEKTLMQQNVAKIGGHTGGVWLTGKQ